MAQRRNTYTVKDRAASEREAAFLLRFATALLIATVGILYLCFSWLVRFRDNTKQSQDLLAPRNKKAYEAVPPPVRTTLFNFVIACIVVVLIFLVAPSLASSFQAQSNLFLALPIIVLCLAAGYYSFVLVRSPGFEFMSFVGEKGDRQTLFHDAEDPLYNEKYTNTTYTIQIPRGHEWNPELSVQFVEQLLYAFQPLLFRIFADDKVILWQVIDLHGRKPEYLEAAIRVLYPEARIKIEKAYETQPITQDISRLTLVYQSTNDFVHPLKYAQDIKDLDPLSAVVSAMNTLSAGEKISFNLFVVGIHPTAHAEGQELITTSTIRFTDYLTFRGWRIIAALKRTGLDRVEKYINRDQKVLEEKLRAALYQTLFTIQIDAPKAERVLTLGHSLDSQMLGFADVPYNGLQWYTGASDKNGGQVTPDFKALITTLTSQSNPLEGSTIQRIWDYAESSSSATANDRWATRLIMTGQEMALLWHLPNDSFTTSRIKWLSSRTVPPPPSVTTYAVDGLKLGQGVSGGSTFPVYLPLKDRENHVRIIGKTGVGKSSLLQSYIRQDIEAGYGVAVIDPHGSLIEDILMYCIHRDYRENVIVLDLADQTKPPPLNPLRGGLTYVQVGQIVQSIERLFPATRQYPRVSHFLRTALLTLNADPEATVRDIVRLFADKEYRSQLVAQLNDSDIQETWDEYGRMKDGERRAIAEPIRNRISPFYTNPDLTPIMCHPDGIDIGTCIRERKILLISLKMNEQRVPETERNLIGALLLSRLQTSGMQSRLDVPYFVYIDEVQRFVNSSLDEMLSEARKFGLSFTVAHQYLDQLPDRTQSALIGNVGASIIFACGPEDAQAFASHTRPYFNVDDIVGLDQFTSVAKIQHDGVTQPAFTLLTPLPEGLTKEQALQKPVFIQRLELHPEALTNRPLSLQKVFGDQKVMSPAEWVRTHSHLSYTPKDREEVLAWLKHRYGRSVVVDNQALHTEPGENPVQSISTGETKTDQVNTSKKSKRGKKDQSTAVNNQSLIEPSQVADIPPSDNEQVSYTEFVENPANLSGTSDAETDNNNESQNQYRSTDQTHEKNDTQNDFIEPSQLADTPPSSEDQDFYVEPDENAESSTEMGDIEAESLNNNESQSQSGGNGQAKGLNSEQNNFIEKPPDDNIQPNNDETEA